MFFYVWWHIVRRCNGSAAPEKLPRAMIHGFAPYCKPLNKGNFSSFQLAAVQRSRTRRS